MTSNNDEMREAFERETRERWPNTKEEVFEFYNEHIDLYADTKMQAAWMGFKSGAAWQSRTSMPAQVGDTMGTQQCWNAADGSENTCAASVSKRPVEVGSTPTFPAKLPDRGFGRHENNVGDTVII